MTFDELNVIIKTHRLPIRLWGEGRCYCGAPKDPRLYFFRDKINTYIVRYCNNCIHLAKGAGLIELDEKEYFVVRMAIQ